MSFVIYNPETTKLLRIHRSGMWRNAAFTTKAAASRVYNGLTDEQKAQYVIEEYEVFKANEKTEIRHGAGPAHGKTFEVKVNTSWTSGPWSETYWCN